MRCALADFTGKFIKVRLGIHLGSNVVFMSPNIKNTRSVFIGEFNYEVQL